MFFSAKGCAIDVRASGSNDAYKTVWMYVNGVNYWPAELTKGITLLKLDLSNTTCSVADNGTQTFDLSLGASELNRLK